MKALVSLNSMRLMCQAHKIKLQDVPEFFEQEEMTAVCAMTYWGIKNNLAYTGKDASEFMSFDTFCAKVLDTEELFIEMAEAAGKVLGGEDTDAEGNA